MTKRKRKKRQNGVEPINIHLVSPVVVSRRPRVPISAGLRLLLYSISTSSRAYSRPASSSLSPSFLPWIEKERSRLPICERD